MVFSIFYFFFRDWIIGTESFSASVNHDSAEYMNILDNLLKWQNSVEGCGHFWYLYVYILVMLCYPVLKATVDYIDKSKQRTIVFVSVSFAMLILNDFSNNSFGQFSHHAFSGLIPASILIIYGHLLYKYHGALRKRYIPLFLALFIALNLLRTYIQLNRFITDDGNKILFWYSSIGCICAICVCSTVLSFRHINESFFNVLRKIAPVTLEIYLIHPMVYNALKNRGLFDPVMNLILGRFTGFAGELLYTITMILLIWMLSLIVAVLLRLMKTAFIKLYSLVLSQKRDKANST